MSLPIEARLLAILAAIMFFISMLPELDAPEDSLNGLYRSHLLQLGQTEATYDLVNSASQGFWHPLTIAGVLLPVWSAAFSVRMYLLLRNAGRAVSSASSGV